MSYNYACLTAWDCDDEFLIFMITYNMNSFVERMMYTKSPELFAYFELISAQLKNYSEK